MKKLYQDDGAPDEVKVSCPVRSGGKAGGIMFGLSAKHISKRLPIAIHGSENGDRGVPSALSAAEDRTRSAHR